MPHALSMPAPGFQALILCGPGSSFPTFTANPDENPKAILPIANRPMVWYPIDFCYRTGITSNYCLFLGYGFPSLLLTMNKTSHSSAHLQRPRQSGLHWTRIRSSLAYLSQDPIC